MNNQITKTAKDFKLVFRNREYEYIAEQIDMLDKERNCDGECHNCFIFNLPHSGVVKGYTVCAAKLKAYIDEQERKKIDAILG